MKPLLPFSTSKVLLVAALCGLTACRILQPVTDLTRYYLLWGPEPEPAPVKETGLRVGFASVTVPAYLDPKAMAWRRGPHEVQYLDNAAWAESLQDGIERVMVTELRHHPSVARLQVATWSRSAIDAEVRVRIERFDGGDSREAVLEAFWEITEPRREGTSRSRRVRIVKPFSNSEDSMTGMVAAMSAALHELTMEIGRALESWSPAPGAEAT